MKKIAVLMFTLIATTGYTRKKIALMGTFDESRTLTKAELKTIDAKILKAFVQLGRFDVLGYGTYRFSPSQMDELVKKAMEYSLKTAEESGTEVERFGMVVISADELENIGKAFLIILPVVSEDGETVTLKVFSPRENKWAEEEIEFDVDDDSEDISDELASSDMFQLVVEPIEKVAGYWILDAGISEGVFPGMVFQSSGGAVEIKYSGDGVSAGITRWGTISQGTPLKEEVKNDVFIGFFGGIQPFQFILKTENGTDVMTEYEGKVGMGGVRITYRGLRRVKNPAYDMALLKRTWDWGEHIATSMAQSENEFLRAAGYFGYFVAGMVTTGYFSFLPVKGYRATGMDLEWDLFGTFASAETNDFKFITLGTMLGGSYRLNLIGGFYIAPVLKPMGMAFMLVKATNSYITLHYGENGEPDPENSDRSSELIFFGYFGARLGLEIGPISLSAEAGYRVPYITGFGDYLRISTGEYVIPCYESKGLTIMGTLTIGQ